jgi:L-ribulose-5-phosphate 3-epimerase
MTSIHRRQLVALGLAAGGLALTRASAQEAAAQGEVSAPTPRNHRGIKRSCKIGMVGEGQSLADKFRLLADLGYDGVELDSPNALELDEVLAAKEASGLAIPGVVDSVHWSDTLGDPDRAVRARGRAGLERALTDAAAYGASTVLLVPAVVNGAIRYHEAWDRCRAEIAALVPLAEELGVRIAFENVWNNFLLSPVEAVTFVDGFESEHVGWYLDLGNLVRYAWPEHWARALGHRVLKLDIKDYSRAKQNSEGPWSGFGVEIGDGDVGWGPTMAALDETAWGCRGERWASAEVGGGDRARLAEILARMDRVLGA